MSTASPFPQPEHPSLESEQRAHEPSMEEILASIRRIIADDDALPLARRQTPVFTAREPATSPPAPPVAPERRADAAAALSALRHPGAAPGSTAPPVHLVAVPDVPAPDVPAPEETPESEGPVTPVHLDALEHVLEEYAARDREADSHHPRPVLDEVESRRGAESPVVANGAERQKPEAAPPRNEAERETRDPPRLVSPATDASVASSFQSLATSMFLRDSDLISRTAREMLRPMLKQWLDDNLPGIVERLVRTEIERVARGGR